MMSSRLSSPRFWAIWLIALIWVVGFAAGHIPWELIL